MKNTYKPSDRRRPVNNNIKLSAGRSTRAVYNMTYLSERRLDKIIIKIKKSVGNTVYGN